MVKGILTSTTSPPISISCFNSISGVTLDISCLKDNESLAKIFCENALITDGVTSPSTDVITCLNLVVNSGEKSLLIFWEDLSSVSINFSSFPVNNLNVTFVFEIGKSNSNSFSFTSTGSFGKVKNVNQIFIKNIML